MNIIHDEITWIFQYPDKDELDIYESFLLEDKKHYLCDNCKQILCTPYSELMTRLERAKLLPDDYKHFCCFCYFFEKIGVLYLKRYFDTWGIDKEDKGILELYFFISSNSNATFVIRVHDYERLLLE